MAEDPSDRIAWLVEVRTEDRDTLGAIRHWRHLRTATEEHSVWVKGFSAAEVRDVAVKGIPSKRIWYSKGNLLFPEGSLLPTRKAPALLWVPIERGLPLRLPPQNHNYFGFQSTVRVDLVRSEEPREPAAIRVPLRDLQVYILTAPAVRLQPLRWVIIDDRDALLVGTPVLPVPGANFWSVGNFLIPAGYALRWPELARSLSARLDQEGAHTLLLGADGTFARIPTGSFRQLSIGSFRQSAARILDTTTGPA